MLPGEGEAAVAVRAVGALFELQRQQRVDERREDPGQLRGFDVDRHDEERALQALQLRPAAVGDRGELGPEPAKDGAVISEAAFGLAELGQRPVQHDRADHGLAGLAVDEPVRLVHQRPDPAQRCGDPAGGVQTEAVPDALGEQRVAVQPSGERDLTAVQPRFLAGDPRRGRWRVIQSVQPPPVDVSDPREHDGLEPVELSEQHLALGQRLRASERDRVLRPHGRHGVAELLDRLGQPGRPREVRDLAHRTSHDSNVCSNLPHATYGVKVWIGEIPLQSRGFPSRRTCPQI